MPVSADTWGISGPTFLLILFAAFVLAIIVSVQLHRGLARGRMAPRDLHPYEVAYLVGRGDRAVAASLASLRSGGAIEAVGLGELRILGDPRMPLHQLDLAVLHAIGQGMSTHVRTVPLHSAVRFQLDVIRARLEADGLTTNAQQRRRERLAGTVPLLAVLLLGGARLIAGISAGKPVGNLVFLLVFTAIATLVSLLAAATVTRAGFAAVRDSRLRNGVLSPSMSPSWATYGPSAAGLGVALFGAAALVSLDPEFAAASQIPHHFGMATGSSSSDSSSSDSSSSGSGCGGGSSCGGSSCGGGGGCGG